MSPQRRTALVSVAAACVLIALKLGTGLLNSVVELFSFAFILWGLSAATPLPLFGVDLSFPGYLIWIALAYASVGTVVAHLIGCSL